MNISEQQLLAIMPKARYAYQNSGVSRAQKFLPYINRYMEEFNINTTLRVAHFLSQIAHESAELQYTEELGNASYFKKYDGRKDLGNVIPGDGAKYKGRGLIQITGRANYKAYKDFCGFDVLAQPQLLAQPLGATRSACWFWKTKGLNALADADDLIKITKRINGGTNGLQERTAYLKRAKQQFKIK